MKLFKKIGAWFHRHPGIKTTAVSLGGAAVSAAASGVFGPKAALVAGAVGAIVGGGSLHIKRPADATAADKAGIVPGDVVRLKSDAPGTGLKTVNTVVESAPGQFQAVCVWFDETNNLQSAVIPVADLVEEVK